MAITFVINVTRNPDAILDVDVQLVSELKEVLTTESGIGLIIES